MSEPTAAPDGLPLIFSADVVCPYACMALFEVEALAARIGRQLIFEPVLLGGIFREIGGPDQPTTTWNIAKARHGFYDIRRQGALHGLDFKLAPGHPRRSVEAMRLVTSAPPGLRLEVARSLAKAYHQHGRDLSDRAALAEVATLHGLHLDRIDDQHVKDELRANTAKAAAAGAFGVPTFRVGDRLWWGADRMALMEQALSGQRPAARPATQSAAKVLRVTHDPSSPFSYLGVSLAAGVATRHGLKLELRPVLLGALFRSIGTPDVPLFAMAEARRAWMARDLGEQAEQHGVPFQFTSHFPVRTVTALRICLSRPDLTLRLYQSLWVDDQNIGDDAILSDLLTSWGEDGPALIAAASAPEVKARLRANNEAAEQEGVFGVPTWQVDGGPPIWGVDRLPLLEAVLGGLDLAALDAGADGTAA